jgi:predicted dehydrogenase
LSYLAKKPLRVLVFGFGEVAAGYSYDPIMSDYFPFSSHAQVLKKHKSFNWDSVVDLNEKALGKARKLWHIPYAETMIEKIPDLGGIDIAVIATPPGHIRKKIIESLPNLTAIILEKPLGRNLQEAREFIGICNHKNIHVQVNFLRRADVTTRKLANGYIKTEIGEIQTANIHYGNGLNNNGSHMIDLVRMILGEVIAVQVISKAASFVEGPIDGDINLSCVLFLDSSISVNMTPIHFSHYRENSLDVWGAKGRLAFTQEGSMIYRWPRNANRLISNESEIAWDSGTVERTKIGHSFYELYDNLYSSLLGDNNLFSPVTSALKTQLVLDAIISSNNKNGSLVEVTYD